MSAVWSEDPRAPIVINISVAQKAAIVDRAPRLLIEFDLTCGDFWFRTHPYVRFHVLTFPDLIHPRELTTVPEESDIGARGHDG